MKQEQEKKKSKDLSEDHKNILKDLVKSCIKEDEEIRKAQTRLWKKNEEFWHGVQYLFWSARDDSWISPADLIWQEGISEEEAQDLGTFYDYVINITRAHGEGLIAAITSQLPNIRFLPDDADDELDLLTAKTYSKIADLVSRHNNAKVIALRCFFYLFLQGSVYSYIYKDTDKKYGTYKIPVYGKQEIPTFNYICPDCETVRDTNGTCPNCGADTIQQQTGTESIPIIIREDELPKTRARVKIFGNLHVKVPYYATCQEEWDYLVLTTDPHKDKVKWAYPDLEEEIDKEQIDTLDRFARSQYTTSIDVESRDLVNVTKCWLRPSKFFGVSLNKKKERDELFERFPDGVCVTLIGRNQVFAEAIPESIEERWRGGQAGLSTYWYSDAMCAPIIQINEMKNQTCNLALDTIEHGIPADYADSESLNFDTFGKFETKPGYTYKIKGRPGEPLGNMFAQGPRATLSKEVPMFIKMLEQDAQFSLGSFPSIYGGPSEGKSRTFAEYDASRRMALQRLSIVWTLFNSFWAHTIEGLTKLYASLVTGDQRFVKWDGNNYVNVWIRESELKGKIGGVEPEGSESFPTSLEQKKALILRFIELNNDYINSVIYSPENAQLMQEVFALTELKIPGEEQRFKQLMEISKLRIEEPVGDMPSVPIEPDVDDDSVHIVVTKGYLARQEGADLKNNNPAGYLNVLYHLRMHQKALMMKTAKPFEATPAGIPPASAEDKTSD